MNPQRLGIVIFVAGVTGCGTPRAQPPTVVPAPVAPAVESSPPSSPHPRPPPPGPPAREVARANSTPPAVPFALRLNVPAFRLDVDSVGSVVASYPVAVGTAKYPTPLGTFEVTRVEWNPRWVPPPSDWAKGEKPMAPGPTNPMGRVKLEFGPALYLHGTPEPWTVGKPLSHGCVRLVNDDAIALAKRLERYAAAEDSATRPARTDTVPVSVALGRPIPLTIVYDEVEVRAGVLRAYGDIYARAQPLTIRALVEALTRAGYETTVDPSQLARAVRRLVRGDRVPLDSLTPPRR